MRPTALEVASGSVTGTGHRSVDEDGVRLSPLAALEQAVLPALQRSPCLVSFSGGADSSFVLAVAARVARREGLPAPIAVTWRFTGAPRAEESRLQEHVMAALSIQDWQRLSAEDDLDLIGPVAQRLLARYGVLHPVNLHLHLPIIELAAGGSLLTGAGGDQILTGWRRPGPATLAGLLRARAPGRLAALVRQRTEDPYPWLQPAVARRAYRAHRREVHSEPYRLDERIGWHARRRDLRMTGSSLEAVAGDHDTYLVNPLVDRRFIAGLRRQVRHTSAPLTRADLLHAVAGGVFPTAATMPRPKAHFLEVFLRAQTRAFTRSWDGAGADPRVVNIGALRDLWSRWPIPGATAGLVQQLWLAAADDGGQASRTG